MMSIISKVWKPRWALLGLGLLAVLFLCFHFRGHIFSAFGWITEATGGKTYALLSIALGLAVLVCFFFWMIFPILVYFSLRDLRRRTAELDKTIQLSLRSPSLSPPGESILIAPERDPGNK